MKNTMLSLRKAFLILGLLSFANAALATTLTGDHYSVTYNDALVGLYGAGSVSGTLSAPGDTVFFTPTQFKASSGSGLVSTFSALTLTFTVDPGYAFTGLSYFESGDYFLLGGGAVDVTARVDVQNAATSALTSLVMTPGAPLDSVTSFADFRTTDWFLSGNLPLLGLDEPTGMVITLNNTLSASAPTAGRGFIEKKFVGLRLVTKANAVPEPASWSLLLAGIMGALLVGNRRRSHGVKTGRSM